MQVFELLDFIYVGTIVSSQVDLVTPVLLSGSRNHVSTFYDCGDETLKMLKLRPIQAKEIFTKQFSISNSFRETSGFISFGETG